MCQGKQAPTSEVARARSAEKRAVSSALRGSLPRILGYALRRTLAPEDAAEVVSETFLTAWRRFDDMPSDDESLLWLYGVAHRVLANQRRGERRRSALSDRLSGELGAAASGWHDPLPSDLAPFAIAWHRLRPEDRELLGFMAWEGLTTEQLAHVLGCSRTAAKLRLHRARRRFAKELTGAGVELNPDAVGAASVTGAATARTAVLGAAAGGAPPAAGAIALAPSSVPAPVCAPARPVRHATARLELKPRAAAGHVLSGRAPARPGTEEA